MGLFVDTLKFPFKPFKRLWWFWLNVIPVLGWLLYGGYTVDIIRRIVKEDKDDLPQFGEFVPTLKTGFFYLLLALILGLIASLFLWIPKVGWIPWLIAVLLIPVMLVQYAVTLQFTKGLDVVNAAKLVFGNFWKYILYNLCLLAILVIWLLASLPIITALITMPAMSLATTYTVARFYKEVFKKNKKR